MLKVFNYENKFFFLNKFIYYYFFYSNLLFYPTNKFGSLQKICDMPLLHLCFALSKCVYYYSRYLIKDAHHLVVSRVGRS